MKGIKHMKEKTKSRVIQILCIVSLIITVFSIQRTYAKYFEKVNTTYATNIKRWVINLNNTDIHGKSQELSTIMQPTFRENAHMNNNDTLVPGREGYFEFVIDYSKVDLAFKYEFDIFDESYYVLMDEEKFYRAINNILDNKVKYNEPGNQIFIKTEVKDDKFYIKFLDNGDKIPEDYRESIFNPFVRLDKSRNSKTGGTGLGLSITKRILNKHNGDIRILDGENGTNFEVYLPLLKE